MIRTDQLKRDYITIVSGLPRSGTSMAMSAVGAGGMEPLIDHIRKADEDNPKGYWEFEAVKKTKEDAEWVEQASGKAVKMVYRLLYDLPVNYWYKVVFMRRDLNEVLASQDKMLARREKSTGALPDEKMEALFTAELDKCQKWLTEQPNFKVLYIDHRDMMNDGLNQMNRINEFLDGGLDVDAMTAVVDPELYRNRNEKI